MATNTTNLSLIKPDLTDKIRIAQINQNMDIIDEKLGPVGSTSLQSQVTPLTTKTANYDKLIENGTDLNSLLTTGVYKSPATAAGVHTLLNCPIETPFVMVVRGEGEIDGCVQLLCGGVSIYTRRGTGSGFPAEWTVPTGGATPSGEYSIDDLYDAIDELLADAKDEIVAELVDDTAGEGDTGKVWSADKVATTFDEKANVDGYYDDLTAGNAEQLISTVNVKDTAPYTFRTAGGSIDIGDRMVDKIVGGTVAWNQMLDKSRYSDTSTDNGITFTNNSDGSVTISGTATDRAVFGLHGITVTTNHIYLLDSSVNVSGVWIGNSTLGATSKIYKRTTGSASAGINVMVASGMAITGSVKLYPQIYDLTQIFGAAIANYIYSLETATPGAGVAWFRKLFPKPYYEYNAGELMSVNVASHDMVGFNQWDEEWTKGYYDADSGQLVVQSASTTTLASVNKIKVLPNTNYSVTTPTASSVIFEYDSDGTYIKRTSGIQGVFTTQPQTYEIAFHIANYGSGEYNNDVCINLSWDGERDGEYEAYEKHSYPIGNVELRGIPQLDADNHLQYDGDVYESDGTVTRKYGIVDLATLTWTTRSTGDNNKGYSADLPTGMGYAPTYSGILPNMRTSGCEIKGVASGALIQQNGADYYDIGVYTLRQSGGSTRAIYAITGKNSTPSGILLWKLTTPTTETADPYSNPQIVNDFGTEEYVDRGVATSSRDVSIPVGHETYYQANLRAKLEMAPNSPADGDGDYVVRQTSGMNEYIKLENAEAIADLDAKKADVDGYYDNLTAGNAEQLISTTGITDNALYNFRTSGGSADIGDREVDKIVGGTVAWNQLVNNGNFADATNWAAVVGSFTVNDNTCIYDMGAGSSNPSRCIRQMISKIPMNHKVLLSCEEKTTTDNARVSQWMYLTSTTSMSAKTNPRFLISSSVLNADDNWHNMATIIENIDPDVDRVLFGTASATTGSNIVLSLRNVAIIDLTQMFGSTIADHIYSLEQATAGAGVAFFRKLFPKPYYAYNTGELTSVNVASHDMVGFNQWDEEWEVGTIVDGEPVSNPTSIRSKNFCACVPNTLYYVKSSIGLRIHWYDKAKTWIEQSASIGNGTIETPSNAYFFKLRFQTDYGATYKNDTCINLSWDGERNGEYEPYVKNSYPMGNVELRGIPKLDADNHLQYNGDTYESDGTVTRKYGIIDLGTVTWTRNTSYDYVFFLAAATGIKKVSASTRAFMLMCDKYPEVASLTMGGSTGYGKNNYDKTVCKLSGDYVSIMIQDSEYSSSTTEEFKTAMSGIYLVYELAEPIIETADPYTNPQIVNDFGTEEYVDRGVLNQTRDVSVPVGHETYYQPNLRAKLEMAPNSPADGDGDYVVRQTSGMNEYIKLENVEAIVDLDAKKADIDGYYEQMTVGNAEQLVSTVGITDKVPYNFRTAGGSADIGDRMVDKIVGGTIVWNQLVPANKRTVTNTPDGTKTYSGTGIGTTLEQEHKYLIHVKITYNGNKFPLRTYAAINTNTYAAPEIDITEAGTKDCWWFGRPANAITSPIVIGVSNITTSAVLTSEDEWTVSDAQVFDLTKMFPTDIVNYLVTLSVANRIEWFRKLFPKPYYEYNAGELMSVKALSHDTVGFNVWDEEWELGTFNEITGAKASGTVSIRSKNYIPVIPGAKYYYKSPFSSRRLFYDANKNFLSISNMVNDRIFTVPDNAYYMMFRSASGTTTYENNVCINLSWDGERNGEYEPYIKRSYPLGDVELRGIPKLDANNSLYYDGDEYTDDGTVTRKYGIVDLGTLTWSSKSESRLDAGMYFSTTLDNAKTGINFTSQNYTSFPNKRLTAIISDYGSSINKAMWSIPDTQTLYVVDSGYSTPADFKAAMSGVYLVYELAEPIIETTDPFQNPQIVDDFGTEEYVDTRDVSIPVGHETVYQPNLRAKLEMSPDSPAGDGDYIVRQSNGENTYVPLVIPAELPTTPTTDGTYVLKVTVSSGTPTLTWVAQ